MTVDLGGDAFFVRIEVVDYENDHPSTMDDANWLLCFVKAQVNAFSAELQASFTTHDFLSFRDQLAEILNQRVGSAIFQTYEGQLRLEVTLSADRHVVIDGLVQTMSKPKAVLSFSVPSDESALLAVQQQLSAVVRSFPVRAQV